MTVFSGMQVLDPAGHELVGASRRIGSTPGTVYTGTSDGYVEDDGFALGDVDWTIYTVSGGSSLSQPQVSLTTVSGRKRLTWTWQSGVTPFNCLIIYVIF